jgi:hypothetical protein
MECVRKRHTDPDGHSIARRMHRSATRIFAGLHGYAYATCRSQSTLGLQQRKRLAHHCHHGAEPYPDHGRCHGERRAA